MKLMILGYARHGKDTVAEILARDFKMKFKSSSFFALERVMVPYFASKGIMYPSPEACYADRVNHRQEWHEEIKRYNENDRARLARELYSEADVYVGIRCNMELAAIEAEKLFDYSIWVDRSGHQLAESTESCTVNPSMANYILDNKGTLDQLVTRTRNLYWDLVSLETNF